MDNILNPGSVYITILRDPVTQLQKVFDELKFTDLLQINNRVDPLFTFLNDPKFYIQGVIKRKQFRVSFEISLTSLYNTRIDWTSDPLLEGPMNHPY